MTHKTHPSILALGLLLLLSTSILAVDVTAADFNLDPTTTSGLGLIRAGSGTVGELLGLEDEFQMDSETHRRILATTNYISYGALNKNRVPCSRRGASYYNCRPGAQANPYRRGCSAITRCSRR